MDIAMTFRRLMVCAALVAAVSSTHMALGQVPSDHDALLAGTESGELRQAEANGYPSPRRVLELEKELRLTDAQKKALKEVADEARPRAVELGKRIVGVEGGMNDAFRTGMVREERANSRSRTTPIKSAVCAGNSAQSSSPRD